MRAVLAALLALAAAWLPRAALAQDAPPPAIEAPAPAPAAGGFGGGQLRIGVMTMQPGEIFWERFGHDAIVVQDTATGAALSYNYGFFDPSEPGFLGRFVRGRMEYMLAALPVQDDLATYRDEGRGVSIQ
jgi:hypothetical protein